MGDGGDNLISHNRSGTEAATRPAFPPAGQNGRHWHRTRRGFLALAGAAALGLMLRPIGLAAAEAAQEYQLKAAFLYKFTLFVEWPADSFPGGKAPLVVATAGNDPFGGALEQAFKDKTVGGHPVVIKHFPNAGAVEACHLLFVAESERSNINQAVQKAGNASLTVGDFDGFTADGGMFRLFTEDNKIRFEVNMEAVQHSRLKISAKLLNLAKKYEK